MRIAIGVAAAAVVLLAALLFLRSQPPTPPPPPVVPRAGAPAPEPAAPIPVLVPAPPPATAAAPPTLADLSRALQRGDDAGVRELLAKLRLLLSPPIPDDQNAAIPILRALEALRDMPFGVKESKAYGALLTGRTPTAEELAEIRGWLDEHRDAAARVTELLREAAERPACRFPPEAQHEIGLDGSLVPRLQRAAQILCVQAAALGAEGKAEAAAESLKAALALARSVHGDPSILAQVAGCALDNSVCEVLQRKGMTSAPGVAESLASLDPARLRDGWDRAILGEACGAATAYLKGAGGPQGANEVAGYVESLSEVRNVAGKPADVQSALQALVRKHAASSPPYASAIPSMPGTLRAIVHSESRFTAARLALDLEGYRQSRGVYPQTLDALGTPLPVDPASGLRFTYRCEGEGFVLESSESQRVLWRTRP